MKLSRQKLVAILKKAGIVFSRTYTTRVRGWHNSTSGASVSDNKWSEYISIDINSQSETYRDSLVFSVSEALRTAGVHFDLHGAKHKEFRVFKDQNPASP